MGPFEAFYASPLQHPFLLWAAALAAGAYATTCTTLVPSLRRYVLALVALSLADAWLTSTHVYGIGTLSGSVAQVVMLFFVLAGDFRFLLLVETATPDRGLHLNARGVATALALTAIVPLLSQVVPALLPEAWRSPRVLFFVYELSFFALTLLLMRTRPSLQHGAWLRPVARFVLLYYGLWASVDALLLATGADLGYGLRAIPNLLYYGGLIAMIAHAGRHPNETTSRRV